MQPHIFQMSVESQKYTAYLAIRYYGVIVSMFKRLLIIFPGISVQNYVGPDQLWQRTTASDKGYVLFKTIPMRSSTGYKMAAGFVSVWKSRSKLDRWKNDLHSQTVISLSVGHRGKRSRQIGVECSNLMQHWIKFLAILFQDNNGSSPIVSAEVWVRLKNSEGEKVNVGFEKMEGNVYVFSIDQSIVEASLHPNGSLFVECVVEYALPSTQEP